MIDLRSDTVTKPSPAMKEAMLNAEVGDDVFGEDSTVNRLEEMVAKMFGMEAGLYCPSGTMSNQIAIKAHTQPLDEIICDKLSHIYNYETGGWAFHSGVSIRLTDGAYGVMKVEKVKDLILPDFDWYPNSKMVCVENTVNKGGGAVYPIENLQALSEFCKTNNLIFHLDGARIFNALVAMNQSPAILHRLFDSISICFSKGLGAPVGSVLVGSKDFIKKARKIRKVMGGGMRQSGILAAACLYALQNNIDRLAKDHQLAKVIAALLQQQSWVKNVFPTATNIVIFEVADAAEIAVKLKQQHILCSPFSATHLRMVTHLDVDTSILPSLAKAFAAL